MRNARAQGEIIGFNGQFERFFFRCLRPDRDDLAVESADVDLIQIALARGPNVDRPGKPTIDPVQLFIPEPSFRNPMKSDLFGA